MWNLLPLAKFKMMTATLYYNPFLINLYYYLFIIYYISQYNQPINLLNSIIHQHYIFVELQTPLPGTSYNAILSSPLDMIN